METFRGLIAKNAVKYEELAYNEEYSSNKVSNKIDILTTISLKYEDKYVPRMENDANVPLFHLNFIPGYVKRLKRYAK
ncbi:hypothetical protein CWI38_1088p0010 [Hamiltosporidium tvaerminnensis]|uniref:Uncharacterized protein n=1 Tax=Hamiltosporidium tvaerminnensis TaxID=1176355 RepID=A0A4Q9LT67_9MICR|nr:hypothetical protein CWI38_1088p0010 [Hamiltosporidium tvaerminnensis]